MNIDEKRWPARQMAGLADRRLEETGGSRLTKLPAGEAEILLPTVKGAQALRANTSSA